MNKYYIDKTVEKVKIFTTEEVPENAYKNLIFNTFPEARGYLENIYKTSLEEEGITEFSHSFQKLKELEEEYANLYHVYQPSIERFEQSEYAPEEGFENTQEWLDRQRKNSVYMFYVYMYRFYYLIMMDRLFKYVKKGNKAVDYRSILKLLDDDEAVWPEELHNQQLQEYIKYLQDYLKAIQPLISKEKEDYSKIHTQNTIKDPIYKDAKNVLLAYLADKEDLDKIKRGYELEIDSHKETEQNIKIIPITELKPEDIRYSHDIGYNIYSIDDDNNVIPIGYIGEAYNRIAIMDITCHFLRNDSKILIYYDMPNTEQVPELIQAYYRSCYDEDEQLVADRKNETNLFLVEFYGKNIFI